MDEKDRLFVAYIGETDIYEWSQGVGKTIMMPELLKACEKLVDEDLLEIKAVRVEAVIKGKKKSFDFLVKRSGLDDTLEKIMGWSLQEEEYEMCQRVKNLQEKLDKENQF